MDKEAFQNDLQTEIKKLPPELVPILMDLARRFGAQLEPLILSMVVNLQRHVMTMMTEVSMGLITKAEIEEMVSQVFKGEIS